MYKLVIVEDEKDVRSRIINIINKVDSNFNIIAEYETGIDAYDGIISDNPDLILTDIKIPYINGIELSKKVREVFPLIKIIFITGFNEFDYAKEAANLGVVGFISKPITFGDISVLLKKAEAALDDEYLTASNLNRLSAFYESSLPIIRENDFYRLLDMTDVTPAFESKLRSNNINLDYPYFVMSIFDFDAIREGEAERRDLVLSSVRKLIGSDLAELCDYEIFNRYEKLCVILKYRSEPDTKELERRLESIIQRTGRYSDMPISVSISSVYYNNKNFAEMLKEAMRALGYRNVMGGGRVFFYGNVKSPTSKLSIDDNTIKELGYILHFQSADDCVARIDDIWENLEASGESLFYTATSILNVLVKACDDLEGLYARYGGPDNLYKRLFEISTDAGICDFLKELVRFIRCLNDDIITDNVERNLRKVLIYLETHFCDPEISFDSLAAEVNYSISYISALLKKKLNTSFIKLLTGLRMEKAKELLTDPTLKIIDVAERLGYSDSYYFSHCFKKHMGLSPKEFRNNEQK